MAAGEELLEPTFWVSFAPVVEFEEGSVCLASTASVNVPSTDLVAEVEALGRSLSLVRERIGEIIFGQREVVGTDLPHAGGRTNPPGDRNRRG